MNYVNQAITNALKKREDDLSLRKLSSEFPAVDFCSNDYLGFAKSSELKNSIELEIAQFPNYINGSTGSRLLTGNATYTEETEKYIANFHNAENALIFNSGYDANIGLFSSLPQRNDTIITDELIHASIIDGCRLSLATRYKFIHNDLDDLESKLKIAKGNIFVVVESIYSMDGDMASLLEISSLCEKYNANLIVDEAHATGIFGKNGAGLVQYLNLENKVFARIVTFGKALGVHGAVVLGSDNLRNYLINFARSFIYTTALPMHAIVSIRCAYEQLPRQNTESITQKIKLFNNLLVEYKINALASNSCIQGILFTSNSATKQAAQTLQKKGFDVRAILSPTVQKGKERLRICLHTFNSNEEIIDLVKTIATLKNG
jgi:8-amino-7-oxononanoate synthase